MEDTIALGKQQIGGCDEAVSSELSTALAQQTAEDATVNAGDAENNPSHEMLGVFK